ncbi:MAG: Gfo/Idh/MocA family oxidoreductase [Spirochaetaceae bacterium]|jgi:predicted dehydrogenase|nr:Gfo/Idh/MocA family oxidoreductase [Spirochaetaceae bacterium]
MATKKIGIIGAENSHADMFASFFNATKKDPSFSDCRITAVSGSGAQEKVFFEKYDLEVMTDQPIDLLGKVDAVMITARDGKCHAALAEPFVQAGIPLFIDKPITTDFVSAQKLCETAKKHKIPLCGGSALKYDDNVVKLRNFVQESGDKLRGGHVVAPLVIESQYSGFWFYASHLTEIMLGVFGHAVKSVQAIRLRDDVMTVFDYGTFSVCGQYTGNTMCYQASVFAEQGLMNGTVDYQMCSFRECKAFAHMLKTGEMPERYEELMYPVMVMEAVVTAYQENRKVCF